MSIEMGTFEVKILLRALGEMQKMIDEERADSERVRKYYMGIIEDNNNRIYELEDALRRAERPL